MEEGVAFSELRAWTVGIEYFAVLVDVASVEQFVVTVARFAATDHVAFDIVEFAESAGELYMGRIIEARVAEDTDAVLEASVEG